MSHLLLAYMQVGQSLLSYKILMISFTDRHLTKIIEHAKIFYFFPLYQVTLLPHLLWLPAHIAAWHQQC